MKGTIKEINIDDILLILAADGDYDAHDKKARVRVKIEDSHLWKALHGDHADFLKYYHSLDAQSLLTNFKNRVQLQGEYLEGDFKNSHIIVKKCGNKYCTVDGDHRVTILKYTGNKTTLCEVKNNE